MLIIQMLVFAILNRWRGSGYFGSKGIKQVIMGIMISLVLYLVDVSIVRSVICGLLFIPLIAIKWGLVFDLGRGKFDPSRWHGWYKILPEEKKHWSFRQKWITDFIGLSIRGAMITAPIGLISGLYWYSFIGFSMPICYEIGYQMRRLKLTKDPTMVGELIFGAVLGTIGG